MALVLSNSSSSNNKSNLQLATTQSSLAPTLLGTHHSRFTLSQHHNQQNNNNNNNNELISTCFSTCSEENQARFIATSDLHGNVSVWQTTRRNHNHNNNDNNGEQQEQQNHHSPFHPKLMSSFHLKAPVTRIKFASNDTLLLAAQANGHVSIIDIEGGKISKTFSVLHQNNNNKKRNSNNTKNSNKDDNNDNNDDTALLLGLGTKKNNNKSKKQTVLNPFENAIVLNDIAVCPDKSTIFATCGDDGRICVFDLKNVLLHNNITPMYQYSTGIPQTCITFACNSSNNNINIFTGGLDGCVRWFQTSSSSAVVADGDDDDDEKHQKHSKATSTTAILFKCIVECPDAHDDIISGIDVLKTSSSPSSSIGSQVLSYSLSGVVRVHDLRPRKEINNSNTTTYDHVLFEDDLSKLYQEEDDEDEEENDQRRRRRQRVDNTLLRCAFSPSSSIVASMPQQGGGGLVVYQNLQQFLLFNTSTTTNNNRKQKQDAISTFVKENRYFINPHNSSSTVTDVCFHPKSDPVTNGETVVLSCSINGTCVVAAI